MQRSDLHPKRGSEDKSRSFFNSGQCKEARGSLFLTFESKTDKNESPKSVNTVVCFTRSNNFIDKFRVFLLNRL